MAGDAKKLQPIIIKRVKKGGHAAHGGGEAFRVGEVTGEAGRAVVVEGHELTQRREAALEFPADLAVLAEEKDFHGE